MLTLTIFIFTSVLATNDSLQGQKESEELLSNIPTSETNDLYPKISKPLNTEKLSRWQHLQTQKLRTYETCSLECKSFCKTTKGNVKVCTDGCTDKFCLKDPPFNYTAWLVSAGILMLLSCFIVKKLIKTEKIKLAESLNQTTAYKRI